MGNQPFLYNIPDSAYDNKTGAGSYQVSDQASWVQSRAWAWAWAWAWA